jgi:MFS transporter, AAHS family, benzoate transport protein
LILATGISPSSAFATFVVPSLIAEIAYIFVQEKYSSFDRLAYGDKKVESNKVIEM